MSFYYSQPSSYDQSFVQAPPWDANKLLLEGRLGLCSGITQRNALCKFRVNYADTNIAEQILGAIEACDPSSVPGELLRTLARLTLCLNYHRYDQCPSVARRFQDTIENYVRTTARRTRAPTTPSMMAIVDSRQPDTVRLYAEVGSVSTRDMIYQPADYRSRPAAPVTSPAYGLANPHHYVNSRGQVRVRLELGSGSEVQARTTSRLITDIDAPRIHELPSSELDTASIPLQVSAPPTPITQLSELPSSTTVQDHSSAPVTIPVAATVGPVAPTPTTTAATPTTPSAPTGDAQATPSTPITPVHPAPATTTSIAAPHTDSSSPRRYVPRRKPLTECAICIEPFDSASEPSCAVYCRTQCGHNFHNDCLREWKPYQQAAARTAFDSRTRGAGVWTNAMNLEAFKCPHCRTTWAWTNLERDEL
jgi:hypothetical protein